MAIIHECIWTTIEKAVVWLGCTMPHVCMVIHLHKCI